ncbi:MAG: LysR substrate-binding domain-containing protein [Gammaproteobacteria bacterium]
MNKQQKKLSLRGLRTFCVAGRHLSFRLAAEELFVTASAVSRQIKSLEQEVGSGLFDRSGSSLSFTSDGQRLFDQVTHLIREIDNVTANYRSRGSREVLRISVQPFFASELLVPRLTDFTDVHPHIDLHLDINDEQDEKHPASADVSIRIFRRAPDNLVSDAFLPLRHVPACSPELYRRIYDNESGATKAFPVLKHSIRKDEWKRWHASSGITLPEPSTTITLNSTVALMRAAEQGLGVTLAPVPAANDRFKAGHLVRLYDQEVITPYRFYFVCTPSASRTRSVRALRSWVLNTFGKMT